MSTTTITRTTCKYPGCGQPAAPAAGTGRRPEYCTGRGAYRRGGDAGGWTPSRPGRTIRGLPHDPDRCRAHLAPVDAAGAAAAPGRPARDNLLGQAPPPWRRAPDAAAVHPARTRQQDRPRHPVYRFRVGLVRPRLVSFAAITADRPADQAGQLPVSHRAPSR